MSTNNNVIEIVKNINPIEATNAMIARESYGFVNTKDVLGAFEASGWTQVSQTVGGARKPERLGFQKHLIRLENPAYPSIEGLTNANNSKPQLVLLNSHDGTTSLRILWGLIRIACLNGIIAGTGINGVRLVHSKSVVEKLPDAIRYMIDNFSKFQGQIMALQGKSMTEVEVKEYVRIMWDARLSNVAGIQDVSYKLPTALRLEDMGTDAYTVFNRVQETLMRGGIHYTYNRPMVDPLGNVVGQKLIATSTRRIAAVSSQVRLNQLAFDTALNIAA